MTYVTGCWFIDTRKDILKDCDRPEGEWPRYSGGFFAMAKRPAMEIYLHQFAPWLDVPKDMGELVALVKRCATKGPPKEPTASEKIFGDG